MANQEKGRTAKKNGIGWKVKSRARKIVAGVCLASAVIVAAIPADHSGVAQAVNNNPVMSYELDGALARNGDLSPSNSQIPDLSIGSQPEYTSYEIRKIDGQWTLLWKYHYFIPSASQAGQLSGVGIISGYNDTYNVDVLNLSADIITGYEVVSKSVFDTYVTNNVNPLVYTLDISPYQDGSDGSKVSEVQIYFVDEYTTWQQKYDQALAAYQSRPGYDSSVTPSLEDLAMTPLVLNGYQMTEENKKMYYCDHEYGTEGTAKLTGYTLVAVRNYARGMEYIDSARVTHYIPDEDTVYVAMLNSNIGSSAKLDENNFKYLNSQGVFAIGEGAFANTQKVTQMQVGEGIAYIGDEAFMNSFIAKVEFRSVDYIGNRVFKDCQYLEEINLADRTTTIGREAFSGCKILRQIVIPMGVREMGFGAFSNCAVLESVDLSRSNGVTIGEYAFYNCPYLSTVTFTPHYEIAIGKAAFALTPGSGTSSQMTQFTFPINLGSYVSAADGTVGYQLYDETGASYTSRLGDYILAGRTNLADVVMPVNFGSSTEERIPMNTFDCCPDLACVSFAKDNNRLVRYDSNLFEDVENHKFYVYGPENTLTPVDGTNFALPRRSTWQASTKVEDYVPYVYTANNLDHYEVGIGNYRYELEINETNDDTASLLSCQFIGTPQLIPELIVPGVVANYRITEMQDNCLDGIKDYIVKLIVDDDSIQMIGDGVFENCAELKEIDLGNSVQVIGDRAFADNSKLESAVIGEGITQLGAEAFADCPFLTDVFWDSPSSYNNLSEIGNNAFYTTSDKLYFHGDIEAGYCPFEYAMGHNAINSASTRICYVSPQPNELYVIRDEVSNEVLLLDYPHYFDLPSSLTAKYESGQALSNEERALLDATMYLVLPEEVSSIDIVSFLEDSSNNPNRKNWVYINDSDPYGNTTFTQNQIYSDDTLIMPGTSTAMKDYYAESGYHPGLFSGHYFDDTALLAYGESTSQVAGYEAKGNDWILSIDMPGVSSIPDYAFDSCERLQSIIISDACEEIGEAAFQNCAGLSSIGTGNSSKYLYDNYLLYEVLPDGTYELNTCLPSRGLNHSGKEIWVNNENDPLLTNVSALNDHVFTNCKNIIKVDLSDTSISDVPAETFMNCTNLSAVELPNTTRNVGEAAFTNNAAIFDVTIPCDSQISDKAFSKDNVVTVWTYPQCDITANYNPTGYDNIYIRFLGTEYTITFYNDDLTEYEVITVQSGANGYYPENDPTPKLAAHAGFTFDGWSFDNPNGIINVTENRQAIATFKDDVASRTYTITFLNDDMSVYEVITVQDGANGFYPENNPEPKLAMHTGYQFSGWNFDHPDKIQNVHEDRQAIATFSLNGQNAPNANDPSNNNGNSNGNGNNNGGNGGNNNGNGSTSDNSVSNNNASYNVVVENGAGSGTYKPGQIVTITAYAAPNGRVFDRWTTSNADIGFSNAYGVSTTFIMPTHDVKVTATYKIQTTSGNSASQNNPSNNNSGNSNSGNNNSNGNSNSNSGGTNGNGTNGNGGTDVTITTDTIDNNHKNLASATVAGSTDNFIIKITDSAAAYAAVEQALRARYGNDLSGIRFVGFDISLYDATGTQRIESTNGLAVTITLPIPDDLIPYAGNNKAAGVVNGALDDMTVRFTTIDGVPCMQFTATHFSPYTIYVDTNNLTLGVTDTTPKTGDGIHPKWFLSMGLVGISGVLFAWKDKKKVVA